MFLKQNFLGNRQVKGAASLAQRLSSCPTGTSARWLGLRSSLGRGCRGPLPQELPWKGQVWGSQQSAGSCALPPAPSLWLVRLGAREKPAGEDSSSLQGSLGAERCLPAALQAQASSSPPLVPCLPACVHAGGTCPSARPKCRPMRGLAAPAPPLLPRQLRPLAIGIDASNLFEGRDADWPVLDYMCYHLTYSDWLVFVRFYCIFIVIKSCSNILSAPSSAHCTKGRPQFLGLKAGQRVAHGSSDVWPRPPLLGVRSVTRDLKRASVHDMVCEARELLLITTVVVIVPTPDRGEAHSGDAAHPLSNGLLVLVADPSRRSLLGTRCAGAREGPPRQGAGRCESVS